MALSLGARLRAQRERQQISLAAIAEQTKIRFSLLEGLERGDVARWPEGIFRRAYVRAYAQAIGLEPGPVVSEFLERYPDTVEVIPATLAASGTADDALSQQPPTRLRCLIDSAMAAIPDLLQRVQRLEPVIEPKTAEQDRGHDRGRAVQSAAQSEFVSQAPDLSALALLCTRLGQAVHPHEVSALLEDATRILGAVGLVVWSWEPRANVLKASLAHGYSDAVLAQLPSVRTDEENAIASAFRSARTCTVDRGDRLTGAVVVPLMGPNGCVGVLALELTDGAEQREHVRALAMIVAAQLATLVESVPLAEAVNA